MNYPHEIIYKNIRNAYARINRDGVVVFTIPKRKQWDQIFLDNFLKQWEKLYIKYSEKHKVQSTNENWFMIFGEWMNWSDFFNDWKDYSQTTKEKKLKEILFEYSKEWIDKFSNQLWLPYKSLTIRKMKARWGSCNSKQDIVLNLQLIHIPQKYIQYVCAHECAHLIQKNHSDKFWAVVETLYPNYKRIRKEMRDFVLE